MKKANLFPSPIYAETVLSANFADAQRLFLEALIDIHYAHTLMLAKQGIMPVERARKCVAALDSLDRKTIRRARYEGQFEDLFFFVEAEIERFCGIENAGWMHTARSRNDIDLTMYRMCLRREVLLLTEAINGMRGVLIELARRHIDSIMPAYTHTQPAQPTTLAHYLLAAIECFERDERRLRAAFETINRNPLGACAITTTGFPIDRHYTTSLLGFEGLQLNSYGAVAASDYVTEAAGVIATAMVNLGRLVQDLLLWCNPALNFLRLSDAWVQISSIMPQKRNPVALEHTRILASKALAQAQSIFTAVHNTPFGDIVDCEDDLQPLVFTMTADAVRAIRLFGGLIEGCEFNTDRMAECANADFLTVTELADTIARETKAGFRIAHHLVSAAVRQVEQYSPEELVTAVLELAPSVLGKPLEMDRSELVRVLDARWFVEVRRIPGGPAREAVTSALAEAEKQESDGRGWIAAKKELLSGYAGRIEEARAGLLRAYRGHE